MNYGSCPPPDAAAAVRRTEPDPRRTPGNERGIPVERALERRADPTGHGQHGAVPAHYLVLVWTT